MTIHRHLNLSRCHIYRFYLDLEAFVAGYHTLILDSLPFWTLLQIVLMFLPSETYFCLLCVELMRDGEHFFLSIDYENVLYVAKRECVMGSKIIRYLHKLISLILNDLRPVESTISFDWKILV